MFPLAAESAAGYQSGGWTAAARAAVVGKALERLPAAVPAFGMSPLCYGKSDEHIHFPDTVTTSHQGGDIATS